MIRVSVPEFVTILFNFFTMRLRDFFGSAYCLLLICFGSSSGVLREAPEELPKRSRSGPEELVYKTRSNTEAI